MTDENVAANVGSNRSLTVFEPVTIDGVETERQLDKIALGALPALPVNNTIPDQRKQPLESEVVARFASEYAKTKTPQEQMNLINYLGESIRASSKGDDVKAAEYLSMAVDGNGTKLFENREEAMRFINRTRGFGLRGLSRSELYNLRKKKNRRAIFFNTVNKTLPPEEITKKDGRYYVDTHPLPYQF